jgi:hypothetical protein
MEPKTCSRCGIKKEITEFPRHPTGICGYSSMCKNCKAIYAKEYYLRFKDKKRQYSKDYRRINSDAIKLKERAFKKQFPWRICLKEVMKRCTNPKSIGYKYYGGRGILCLLTADELKFLWERDKAFEMKRPSIHRLNKDGNYCLENCVIIEWEEHLKIKN